MFKSPPARSEDVNRLDGSEGPAKPVGAAVGPEGLRFQCTLCGDCCTGSQVVRLTSGDLRLLVAKLGLASVRDLRTRGLVTVVREPVGADRFVWRPRIRFRTKPLRQCPFLVNDVDEAGVYRGLCSLHPDFKPLICTLAPWSRDVEDPGTGAVTEAWSVVAPVEGCPGMGQGPELAPPTDLRPRLDQEVEWMRWLITESPRCADEDTAWALVEAGLDR